MIPEAPVEALARDGALYAAQYGVSLVEAMRRLVADRDEAAQCGREARAAALERYGLERFLTEWDALLAEAVAR